MHTRKEAAMTVKDIIKLEMEKLPESALSEVLDFIQFLELKREKGLLAKGMQQLSGKSFDAIWNNEEDAVYDNL